MFTTSADLHATSTNGLNVLHYAVMGRSTSTVKFLEEYGPVLFERVVDSTGKHRASTLTLAIESSSMDLVQKFWQDGVEKCSTGYGWGLGHFAVGGGVYHNVRLFLASKNIDWNVDSADLSWLSAAPDHFQGRVYRPLHLAALYGIDTSIAFLQSNELIYSIDIPTPGMEGYSPLHLAALGGRPSTVKLLKEYGADVDLQSRSDQQTPLHLAARYGHATTVIALLQAGCAPNPVDANGMTPELFAIENEDPAVVKILCEHLDALEAKLETTEGQSSEPISSGLGSKTWRLPLLRSPHTKDVIRDGSVTIYAVRAGGGSEAVREALNEKEGDEVMCLGKPYRRRV